MSDIEYNELDIAIVGMAGRFPDADDVEALWRNVCNGKSAVRQLDDQQLLDAGVSEQNLASPDYVKVAIPFANKDQFDAGFFGYSPKEATKLDPQQRLFLQTCWHALEDAGLAQAGQFTGVYAGCGLPAYLMNNLLPQQKDKDITSLLALTNGSEKDSLATRISYELDLTGPAVTVQTACSTSLVAVHMACRGLQNYECDTALAGGVWINLLDDQGYLAPTGGSLSPSGQLSAFSEHADGILIGSGTAAVVLKRVSDAIEDGDHILAVIKGSAINNDGRDKVGYTAPSVNGQSNVITAALDFADVDPRSIGLIEAHGTGTILGDPIEIAALTRAYQSDEKQFCAIGSIKANIGHLDSAAGVTGLIKTVQALRHQTIPASIHSTPHNSKIDFANSPFYVPEQSQPWQSDIPRRAAVSSLGMGGTNAHVILEEYTSNEVQANTEKAWHILPFSASDIESLKAQQQQLYSSLNTHGIELNTVASQLQHNRRALRARTAIVATDLKHAQAQLARSGNEAIITKAEQNKVALLFSGQGSQYVTMAQALFHNVPAYKYVHEAVITEFDTQLQRELNSVFSPAGDEILKANQLLNQTRVTQPALFVVGYAMAKCYQAHGIEICGMLGHSIGQYVAACLAQVMTLSDAVKLVSKRGEILQTMAPGTMLSVMADESTVQAYLNDSLSIAALNSSTNTVLAGTCDAIKQVQAILKENGISCTRLHVSHAFHSHLTEPVLPEFAKVLNGVHLQPPKQPFVSDLTGTWITDEQATSVQYWLDHIRKPVNFRAGVATLAEQCQILVEAGPGDTLQKLAKQTLDDSISVYHSISHARDLKAQIPPFAKTLAALWQHGCDVQWSHITEPTQGQKIIAPLYQFADTRFWQAAQTQAQPEQTAAITNTGPELLAPVWHQVTGSVGSLAEYAGQTWLLVQSDHPLVDTLSSELEQAGIHIIELWQGESDISALNDTSYRVNLNDVASLEQLASFIDAIDRVLDMRLIAPQTPIVLENILALAKWSAQNNTALSVLASEIFSVLGDESINPHKATVLGLTRTLVHEYPTLNVQFIEVDADAIYSIKTSLLNCIKAAITQNQYTELAARGKHLFSLSQQVITANTNKQLSQTNTAPVTLITGGLGGVGLVFAKALAGRGHKLVLLSRSAVAPSSEWCELSAEQALYQDLHQLKERTDVVVVQADVANMDELQQGISQAEQQVGTISEVIHAAGTAGGAMISQLTTEQIQSTLVAKVQGTDNLLQIFAKHDLSHMVLCSSLATVLGAFGQTDYCGANAYLDAVSHQLHPYPVIAINWDAWTGIGMAAEHSLEAGLGLDTQAGVELYLDAVQSGCPQVYAPAMSWEARALKVAELMAQATAATESKGVVEQGKARPPLEVEFEAPESELEIKLAVIWCEALGFNKVGIFDSFFELGGDSLMAIQMIAQVKQLFSIEIAPASFFEDPTLDNLAFLVEEQLLKE
jgi:acyl transferase domain-containing protein/acyl carrier protein